MEAQFLCHDFKRRAQEPSILTLLSGAYLYGPRS
jgi:hypothetical protein